MKLEYTVQADDYLTYQLHAASKSDFVRKRRVRSRWIVPILYLIISIPAFTGDRPLAGVLLIVFSALWYAFYPYFEARRYVRNFKAYIAEHYQGRFGDKATVELDSDHLLTQNGDTEVKLSMGDLEAIDEIGTHIFVKFKNGTHLILPKHQLPDRQAIAAELKTIAMTRNIPYNEQLNWVWK